MSAMILKDIIDSIHDWAPPAIAQSYDNVGLQVGDPNQLVTKGLVALEVTPAVIDEAEIIGAEMIISHHPLLFRPLKSLSPSTLVGSMAMRLARTGIALVAAHTNLDSLGDGVSSTLADLLELQDKELLSPVSEGIVKLVTFVPEEHAEAVRQSIIEAGAGRVGDYSDVSFENPGIGMFKPLSSSEPYVGTPGGGIESVRELRIEVALTRDKLPRVLRSLVECHPYETPMYDVYELTDTASGFGLGMIGNLAQPESLPSFLARVCARLNADALRYVGDPSASVHRIAVCGGAGRDLITTAMRRGADAYVTSDVSYHSFFDALDSDGHPAMAVVDAGHYETEASTETLLVDRLTRSIPQVSWERTRVRTSPVATFTAP